jgi:hypothetical protein
MFDNLVSTNSPTKILELVGRVCQQVCHDNCQGCAVPMSEGQYLLSVKRLGDIKLGVVELTEGFKVYSPRPGV